ncbi:MAG: lyase family protein, partial [Ferruginibacter sp.]
MQLSPLLAVSPIDGRYHNITESLSAFFSEYALIKYRVKVEVEYFILLGEKKFFKNNVKLNQQLRKMVENFSIDDAEVIKKTEVVTNHDVKAVEYFVKLKLDELGAGASKEWVHFGLTSQDINNTAVPMLWKDAIENQYLPDIINLQQQLFKFAQQWKHIPMLARTHGQPASPTRLGKELLVFVERLENQIQLFSYIPF